MKVEVNLPTRAFVQAALTILRQRGVVIPETAKTEAWTKCDECGCKSDITDETGTGITICFNVED